MVALRSILVRVTLSPSNDHVSDNDTTINKNVLNILNNFIAGNNFKTGNDYQSTISPMVIKRLVLYDTHGFQ